MRSVFRLVSRPLQRLWRRTAIAPLLVLALGSGVALQAQAQCATTNIARSGIASASSTYPGYDPTRTNDGNRNTTVGGDFSWANAETPPLPATLEIALGAPVSVNQVVLYTSSGWEIRDFDLQYSNGGGWVLLLQVRGNTQTVRTLNFPQVSLSRLRLVGLRGPNFQPGYVRVNELEICSAAAQTAGIAGQVVLFRGGLNPPLPNVTVDIGGGRRLTTDANGNYSFNNLPAGTYTARASRAGLTCGSAAFQQRTYTRTVAGGGAAAMPTIVCYDRNPIVYSKGWTGSNEHFSPVYEELRRQGYRGSYANIETTQQYTPSLDTNAKHVSAAIDEARDVTGQPQAILFGHSMGGLVSRAYTESALYRRDVSELFTFGSPHQGVLTIAALTCAVDQPAVCQMSKPGMLLFNVTHRQRPGVTYHNIGGDSPMFRSVPICFRLFGRRVCFNALTVPVPDFRFRNRLGFATGLLIPGPDDGLAQTFSATGMPGLADRFVTREVHSDAKLGHRDFFDWNNGTLSAEAYDQCVKPVLVLRNRRYCDFSPTPRPLIGFPALTKLGALAPALSTDTLEFNQRSRTDRSAWVAAQRIERSIWVDGSPTVFSAQWTSGSGRVVLIDPSGQVFDPEYAASIYDGEALPGEPLVDQPMPELVLYESDASGASYQFPAPRPGRWRMLVDAGADAGVGGTLGTNVVFASAVGFALANDFPFLLANTQATIRLAPSGAIFSGTGQAKILRADGGIDQIALARQPDGSFVGQYSVANAPGIAEVVWFVEGTNATGQPFERGGGESVQIGRRTLAITGVGAESAVPSPTGPEELAALEIPIDIQSNYAGAALIAGTLVDTSGETVAGTALSRDVAVGANRAILRFEGADIFANRRNGPYRLTHLITADQRNDPLLSDWLLDQRTTAAYDHRRFGPPPPSACGTQNLLRTASASASSTYSGYSPARTNDGNRNTSLGEAYSWANARETATTSALPASLSFALATPASVDQIVLYTTAGWEMRDYDLEYFEGAQWSTIERVRDNRQTVREHRFPTTRMSNIRIVGLSGPDHQTVHVRVNEVEAYRCDTMPTFVPIAPSPIAVRTRGSDTGNPARWPRIHVQP